MKDEEFWNWIENNSFNEFLEDGTWLELLEETVQELEELSCIDQLSFFSSLFFQVKILTKVPTKEMLLMLYSQDKEMEKENDKM